MRRIGPGLMDQLPNLIKTQADFKLFGLETSSSHNSQTTPNQSPNSATCTVNKDLSGNQNKSENEENSLKIEDGCDNAKTDSSFENHHLRAVL